MSSNHFLIIWWWEMEVNVKTCWYNESEWYCRYVDNDLVSYFSLKSIKFNLVASWITIELPWTCRVIDLNSFRVVLFGYFLNSGGKFHFENKFFFCLLFWGSRDYRVYPRLLKLDITLPFIQKMKHAGCFPCSKVSKLTRYLLRFLLLFI